MIAEDMNVARELAREILSNGDSFTRTEDAQALARAFREVDNVLIAAENEAEKMRGDLATIHEFSDRNSEVHTGFVHIRRIAAVHLS